jgi:TetR/AcrR family transcriptional regulator
MVTSSRDPVRTRERILRSARREFVAKGFAGARVDAIARAASVNKRMLYHYFGDKEALYRATLREGIATNFDLVAAAPPDPADLLPFLFARASKRVEGIRLLQWEALGAGDRQPIAEEERRKAWVEGTERIRDAQRTGRLHQDLDAEYLVLALMALTIFPQAFPQLVHMVTGVRRSDAEFQQRQTRFLRRLGTYLRPPSSIHSHASTGGGPAPRRPAARTTAAKEKHR